MRNLILATLATDQAALLGISGMAIRILQGIEKPPHEITVEITGLPVLALSDFERPPSPCRYSE